MPNEGESILKWTEAPMSNQFLDDFAGRCTAREFNQHSPPMSRLEHIRIFPKVSLDKILAAHREGRRKVYLRV